MFCRCRYLRAPHFGPFLPVASPLVLKHPASRAVPISWTSSQSFAGSSTSRRDEKVLDDKHGNVPDIKSLLGSIRSPLAFKPLPSVTLNTSLPGEEVYLEPESEEELSPPVALHTEDPLFPRPCSDLTFPNATWTVEDVKEPSVASSKAPAGEKKLPWGQYVKRLKAEKLHRQTTKASSFHDPVYAIQEWNEIRTWDRFQIANLSVFQWVLLVKAGCLLSNPSVLYHVPAELVDAHAYSPRAQHSMVVKILCGLFPFNGRNLTRHTMFDPLLRPWNSNLVSELETTFNKNLDHFSLDLFNEYFQDKPTLVVKLPRDIIFHLVAVASHLYPKSLSRGGLLSAFFVTVRRAGPKLTLAFPLRDPGPLNNAPTGHVWALFRLVQVYINSESRQEAFRLFQRLVREKMITSSAISQVQINQEDPRTAVLFAISKTCLDYEWNTGALELMILAAQHDPTIFDEQMRPLVNETLYVLLKQAASMSPAQNYHVRMVTAVRPKSTQHLDGPKFLLRRIMVLIKALRRNHQAFEIEDRVIQNFYSVAKQLDFHHIAEVLFSIGRICPPPPTSARSMLVSPSFAISDNSSSRYLLPVAPRHLTYNSPLRHTPLPSDAQPEDLQEPLITATAQYPTPRGPPLLWLLEAMLKKSKNVHLCRHLAKEVVGSSIDIPVYDRGHFIRLVASAGFARAAKELWKRYSEDENQGVIGHAGAMMRLVSLFYHLGQELEAKEAMIDEGPEIVGTLLPDPEESLDDNGNFGTGANDEEDAKVLSEADAARGFAKEVVEKFRACKQPIRSLGQQDLNALARAYFMMDRAEEGFALFEIVKATRLPDMYDVNVGLSGVAKYNVELASRMVDRMHGRGLLPDSVTWGTLIHLASLKGNMGLVISLVKRAQERNPEFSSRTISSLIRASLSDVSPGSHVPKHTISLGKKRGIGPLQLTLGGDGSAEQIGKNLDMAWHLIEEFDTQAFVGTWSLANFCLDRALWLGDAELAFRFWAKYLRSKTQWDDPGQVKSRKKLYELVATAKGQRKLEVPQATGMLRKLSGSSERGLYYGFEE